MTKVDVTWARTIRIWWSYLWRTALFSSVAVLVAAPVTGMAFALIGADRETATSFGFILGQIITIPISLIALKTVLKKKYAGFSVALITELDS